MFDWLRNLMRSNHARRDQAENDPDEELRPVPGAVSATREGRVIFNILDPIMQQFWGDALEPLRRLVLEPKEPGNSQSYLVKHKKPN